MSHSNRRELILELVVQRGYVSVEQVAVRVGVSTVTARRDLERLDAEGLLVRTHGGASAIQGIHEHGFAERLGVALQQKRAIGRAAAGLVTEGATVALDAGTTTLEIARQLTARSALTVITSSLRVLDALARYPHLTVLCTGGTVKHRELALVGSVAERMLAERRPDIAFVSAAGVRAADGPTDHEDTEVALKRAMIACASRVYLVVDSTKFGVVRPVLVAPLTAFSGVVTDEGISGRDREEIRALGLDLVVGQPIAQALPSSMQVART